MKPKSSGVIPLTKVLELLDKEIKEWEEVQFDDITDIETVIDSIKKLKTNMKKEILPDTQSMTLLQSFEHDGTLVVIYDTKEKGAK